MVKKGKNSMEIIERGIRPGLDALRAASCRKLKMKKKIFGDQHFFLEHV